MTATPGESRELRFLDLARHLKESYQSRSSGEFLFVRGEAEKKIFMKNGFVLFASSNRNEDRLGDVLLRREMITRAHYTESVRQVVEKKLKQGTALVQMGAISAKDLFRGLLVQVREIVLSIFEWEDGRWTFRGESALPPGAVQLRLHPVGLIFEGMQRAAAIPLFTEAWSPGTLRLGLHPLPPFTAEELSLPADARKFLSLMEGGRPWSGIVSTLGLPENRVAAIAYTLTVLGLITTPGEAKDASEAAAPEGKPAAARNGPDPGAVRARIEEFNARSDRKTHYQVLGVPTSATAAEIKEAYLRTAREFHPDRFFHPDFDSLQAGINTAFMRINEAYTTLSRAASRDEYDRTVMRMEAPRRQEAGGSRRDSRIAREQFQKGLDLLKAGDSWSAAESFRWAANLSPRTALFHSYLGVALTATKKRLHEAEEHCKTAIALDYNNPQLYVNLGRVYKTGRLLEKARKQFETALKLDPSHADARAEIDALGGPAAGGGPGILKKFLKKQ